ncbi:putative udp-galactose transporter [Fasciola hepatica]|uniref:Udp-galactose transporter n=1 Tax=Fasciola hepatica TaxID=6192 RepID=A0A4E0RBX6_FASHE|nr:putative udp-galactose transporter [Fasciola hepatica]
MEPYEKRSLRPFDTVVNFNEDFHSGSEVSGKIVPSSVSVVAGDLMNKADVTAKNMDRRTKAVLTIFKKPSSVYRMSRRSRSKTRSENRKAVSRVSISSDQVTLQTYTHYQLPVSGSSQPPLAQLRSYSPPEREYPKPIRLPLGHDRPTPNDHETVSSNEDSAAGVVVLNPQLLRMASGICNIVDRSSFNFAQANGAANDLKVTAKQLTLSECKRSLVPEISEPPRNEKSSSQGRAHSYENISNRVAFLSQESDNNTNIPAQFPNTGAEKKDAALHENIKVCETELKRLCEQLVRRPLETEQISQEPVNAKPQEQSVKSPPNELTYVESISGDTFHNLKNKIGELYADLESLRCAHTQALDKQADLQEEVLALRRSCDWYAEQLKLTQCSRDKFCCENEKLQSLLKEMGEHNHRLTHENNCLQAQLACAQAASATAKRNLSAQLDAIRIDMIEREAIFERFSTERASLEKLNMERAGQVNALQIKVANLQRDLKFAEERTTRQRARLEFLESYVSSADLKQTELQGKLLVIEQKRVTDTREINEHLSGYSETVERFENLQRLCKEKDDALTIITEEKAALEFELNAACREKETLNEYLDQLKENLVRIEESFDRARSELDLKQIQLISLTYERDALQKQIDERKQQEELKTQSQHNLPKFLDKVKCSHRISNDKSQIKIDVAVQTEVQLLSSHKLISHMPNIHSKSVVVSVPYDYAMPNSLELLTSESSLATYKQFSLGYVAQNIEGSDSSNISHSFARYEQPPLPGYIAQEQVNYAAEQSHGIFQSSYKENAEVAQETAHLAGIVFQSHLGGTSDAVPLSSERSSASYTPYEYSHQCQGELCEACSEKSLRDAGRCSLSDRLKADTQRPDEFSAERAVDSEVPSNCIQSETAVYGSFGANDVVRVEIGLEEIESAIQSRLEGDCSTKGASDFSMVTHNHGSQSTVLRHNDAEKSKAPEIVRSPLCDLTFIVSAECENSEELNLFDQPPTTASDAHRDSPHLGPHEPHLERPHLSPLNALEAQFGSCADDVTPVDDISVGQAHQCVALGQTDFRRKSRETTGSVLLMSAREGNNESHFHKTVGPCVQNMVYQGSENPESGFSPGLPEAQHSSQPADVIVNEEALFDVHMSHNKFATSSSVLVSSGQSHRETIFQRLAEENQRATNAVSNSVTIRESSAHLQAIGAPTQAMIELDATRTKLNELQSEVESLRNEAKNLRQESATLRASQNVYTSAHVSELEALRSIIKTTTNHLAVMSASLKDANEEKMQLQKELAHIKGSIRGQLENFRLFSPIKSVDSMQTLPEKQSSESVTCILRSIGFDVHKLEDLVGDNVELPILNSKPLTGLNKCFDALQAEISNLENEIVHHSMVVQNSMDGSLRPDGETIPATERTKQFCDREP